MVTDESSPEVTCPDNITVSADPENYLTTIPPIPLPQVTDHSAILAVVRQPAQLVPAFSIGQHVMTYRVTDVWNNSATCQFFITVCISILTSVRSSGVSRNWPSWRFLSRVIRRLSAYTRLPHTRRSLYGWSSFGYFQNLKLTTDQVFA